MTSWTTGICEANGINIHYLRTGGVQTPVGSAPWVDGERSLLDSFGSLFGT